MKLTRSVLIAATLALGCVQFSVRADEELDAIPDDLTSLRLEDLMNLEITSVSKQKQRVGDTPAAVTVIGQEDIQRSGLTTIPDLLRLVPGMDVARQNASNWAVSARGFNDIYSNKLLVLMDGRSVYTPAFSGVFWSQQDYILQDLDRIEVVRGPGGTLWGSNAVNGVINIQSKDSRDTKGWLFTGNGGTEGAVGAVRYGGMLDEDTTYRVYTQYRYVDDGGAHDGVSADDSWQSAQAGFRIDRHASVEDVFTLQGDLYQQWLNQKSATDFDFPPSTVVRHQSAGADGGNVLGRWTHTSSRDSGYSLQIYYDRLDHYQPFASVQQDTFDIDFQDRFPLSPQQEIIWGLGYRYQYLQFSGSPNFTTEHSSRSEQIISAFVQDDITLVPDRLHLFVGTKLEYNSFTDLEIQPGARLLWTPNEHNTFWASVAHAVRTPSRYQEDATIIANRFAAGPTVGLAYVAPNRDLSSEQLNAFELGYRFQPVRRFSLDVSLFYNEYDDLIGNRTLPANVALTPPVPHLAVPILTENNLSGEGYGGEIAATWQVADNWKLVGSFSLLELQIHPHGGADAGGEHAIEGGSPQQQIQLRSYLDLTKDLQFNALAYYVSPLAAQSVPGYVRLDLNLAWRPNDHLEVAVGVQNLLDDRHPEFTDPSLQSSSTESQRSYFASLTYRY